MIKNYITIAIRSLLKRKVYSFINIFGLAIGVAVCLVILKYVDFELSYDSFHKNADRIFRTTTTTYQNGEFRGKGVLSGYAQGPSLLADVPEIKSFVRTHPMYGGVVVSYERASGDPSTFHEDDNIQFVDSTFLHVFTYTSLKGDLNTALENPNSVVITKKIAEKYFGEEDPIGKVLKASGG
jgi:putative ABC transport system permease protein